MSKEFIFFPADKKPEKEEGIEFSGITVRGAEGRTKEIVMEEVGRRKKMQDDLAKKFYEKICQNDSVFDGFLDLLREKQIPVSTPEWLQFLKVVKEKTRPEELEKSDQLFNTIRLYAKTILVKNKELEPLFHEAFDEYFELIRRVLEREIIDSEEIMRADPAKKESGAAGEVDKEEKEINTETEEDKKEPIKKDGTDADDAGNNVDAPEVDNKSEDDENEEKAKDETEPEQKEKLGIDKAADDLEDFEGGEHDNEQIHGGKKDQHNDILRRGDLSKKGGGNIKNEEGGKGKSEISKKDVKYIFQGEKIGDKMVEERKREMEAIDARSRYEKRPDRASMRQVIRDLRKIIVDVSDVKSDRVDIKKTVKNFSKRDFSFEYKKEREKQQEVVLMVDVGGPVDEWSPLIKEVAESMTKGLSKLEIYLFHNNLYGYAWEPDKKDPLKNNLPTVDTIRDLKNIIKKRKKVIVYGDSEMSDREINTDEWIRKTPEVQEFIIKNNMTIEGSECLNYIKKKSDSVVWINPIFKKEWEERDVSRSINTIKNIIPMYDLTVGGVEDAIRKLMKK